MKKKSFPDRAVIYMSNSFSIKVFLSFFQFFYSITINSLNFKPLLALRFSRVPRSNPLIILIILTIPFTVPITPTMVTWISSMLETGI